MNRFIGSRLGAMKEYVPNTGDFSVRLDANESPMTPDGETKKRIAKAVAGVALNRYPDPYAVSLTKKYAEYIGVDSRLVVAGNGSDELISVIISGFFESGDKLLITPPDFSMYEVYAQQKGLNIVKVRKTGDTYKIPAGELIERINEESPRCVMFSNPCNPLGKAYSREEILTIVKSVSALCVVDEAYMDFFGDSVAGDIESFDNLIVLRTASKALGLAGIRLGFAIANSELAAHIRRTKSPFNVNSITQAVGEVILSDTKLLDARIETIVNERKYLESRLSEMAGNVFCVIPTVTNFALIRFPKRAEEVFEGLKKAGVLVRLLEGEYLRITAGERSENDIFLGALKSVIKELSL